MPATAATLDDDLVFVAFSPVTPLGGHGFPTEIGPQFDAHADAWLDALDLGRPNGFRVDLTEMRQPRAMRPAIELVGGISGPMHWIAAGTVEDAMMAVGAETSCRAAVEAFRFTKGVVFA